MILHTAASLTTAFDARFAQPGTVDLQASAAPPEPNFGGEVESIQAAGVLSFNSAGKMKTAKAQSHFGVLGQLVQAGELVELPEADFNRMGPSGTGQVVEATEEDIAAAQKTTKGK